MAWFFDNGNGHYRYSMLEPLNSVGWVEIGEGDPNYNNYRYPEKYNLNVFVNDIVRPERDLRLDASDKYILSDFPLPSGVSASDVTAYRQSLRDFPSTVLSIPAGGVDDLSWPLDPVAGA